MKIGVIGANGFVGSYLQSKLDATAITKHNYRDYELTNFDILINANGNSMKFWANTNPYEDFQASVSSCVYYTTKFRHKYFIQISSVDALPPIRHPYGNNKNIAERVVEYYTNSSLILRCPSIVGPGLKKGPLKSILNREPVYLTPDSTLQFISLEHIATIIRNAIIKYRLTGVMEVGDKTLCSTDNISIQDLGLFLNVPIDYNQYIRIERYNFYPTAVFDFKTCREYIQEYIDEGME